MKRQLSLFSLLVVVFLWWHISVVFAGLEDGLAGYYPMEGNGDKLKDFSGNGNDGRISGAQRTDGKFGKGLQFSQIDHNAVIPHSDSLNVEEEFTVAVWVKPDVLRDGENRVVYKHNQYNLDLFNGRGRLEVRSNEAWHGTGGGPRLTEKEWHHIVGTYLAKEHTAVYYVDGNQVAANAGVPDKIDQVAEKIAIGGPHWFGLAGVVGILDELRFYNRALDSEKVEELFQLEPTKQSSISPASSLATMWGILKRSR